VARVRVSWRHLVCLDPEDEEASRRIDEGVAIGHVWSLNDTSLLGRLALQFAEHNPFGTSEENARTMSSRVYHQI
jgi:hypothetical protein